MPIGETTLDHIDSIIVTGEPFTEPANEYWQLVCFREGLETLNRFAVACDTKARKFRGIPDCFEGAYSEGGSIVGIGVNLPLLTCAYQWYSVTACQYVGLVGAIARRQDQA